MTDQLKKRGFVCHEIVDTEERYVHDLEYSLFAYSNLLGLL